MTRCLWLARTLPFPWTAGDRIYTAKLAGALGHAGAEVTFAGFAAEVPPQPMSGITWHVVPGQPHRFLEGGHVMFGADAVIGRHAVGRHPLADQRVGRKRFGRSRRRRFRPFSIRREAFRRVSSASFPKAERDHDRRHHRLRIRQSAVGRQGF